MFKSLMLTRNINVQMIILSQSSNTFGWVLMLLAIALEFILNGSDGLMSLLSAKLVERMKLFTVVMHLQLYLLFSHHPFKIS